MTAGKLNNTWMVAIAITLATGAALAQTSSTANGGNGTPSGNINGLPNSATQPSPPTDSDKDVNSNRTPGTDTGQYDSLPPTRAGSDGSTVTPPDKGPQSGAKLKGSAEKGKSKGKIHHKPANKAHGDTDPSDPYQANTPSSSGNTGGSGTDAGNSTGR